MHLRHFVRATGILSAVAATGLFLSPAVEAASSGPADTGPGGVAALTPAQATTLSSNVTDHVIVVLKDQVSSLPDTPANVGPRTNVVRSEQQPFLTELSETHATHVTSLSIVNAVSATVSPGEAARLASNPDVAQVVQDKPIPLVSSLPTLARGQAAAAANTLASACPPAGQTQLNPEAIETIHAAEPAGGGASAQGLGYTGAGVKVAFIADGLDINNPDFIRANGQHVFVDYQDFSGTGTSAPTNGGEAFLDASSIAAQGRQTYNLATWGSGTTKTCNIRILGVAPGASLVGLNVFGANNFAFNSVFLAAINYAVNVDHVNVLNESFGANPFPDQGSLDLTRMADDAAVAAGVTVTVSSGDAGVTNTIGSPASDPAVISAGASTTYRAYAQSNTGNIDTIPGVKGWLDNNISGLSSAGYNESGGTVDVVAPGDLNWGLCTPDPSQYSACTNALGQPSSFTLTGGTSEASPLTAGTAALVIQAYEETHGGSVPSPAVVKQIIVSTAEDISAPADQQGAGLVDAYAAAEAAASYPGGITATKVPALLHSATNFGAVGAAGSTQSFTETLTNPSSVPVTVALSSRTLGAYHSVASTSVKIADATNDEAITSFTVPAGQARLNANIAYVAAGSSSLDYLAAMNLALVSPSGEYADFNLPQGAGNYGNAEVANPEAGTWRAVIFNQVPSADGGTVGTVKFDAQTAAWTDFGKLSTSSVHLAAGGSASFGFKVTTPSAPGDSSGSIVLTSGATSAQMPAFAAVTTIPVTLRTLIPTPKPSVSFTGKFTGGNGRQTNTGQAQYYEVAVPSGLSELNASITVPDPADTFYAELIDPVTGEAASTSASSVPGYNLLGTTDIVPESGVQLHVLAPSAGLWTLAVNFYNQVSGTTITQPFTVTLNDEAVPVKASSLPDSASTVLPSGSATTVDVTVKNTGKAPEAYFVDPRLDQTTELNLPSLTSSVVTAPLTGSVVPLYVVPTHTSSVSVTATATAPVYFDYWWAYGDPDLISASAPFADTASATFDGNPVVPGVWGVTPFQDGPDGANGVTPANTTITFMATTDGFNSDMSSTTGDLWAYADGSTAALDPVVVAPGDSTTIRVTITPSAASGTVVSGHLYLDDLSLVNGAATWNEVSNDIPQANDVAALPYEYKVG
jgi:subtilisin family serine protease